MSAKPHLLWSCGAVVLCLAGGVGCGGQRAPMPRPDGGVTDAQRNDAMLSIQAHVLRPSGDFGGARFMALPDAIDVVARDKGEGAASRARRVIAKLAARRDEREEFRGYVKTLLQAYDVSVSQFDTDVQNFVPASLHGASAVDAAQLEIAIVNLQILKNITIGCPWEPPDPSGNVRPLPNAGWVYEALIPREVSDVARSLDPQSWSQTIKFFYASYLVDASCCSDGGECKYATIPGTEDPVKGHGFPAGQPYKLRPVFESVCFGGPCDKCAGMPFPWCEVAFKNILCVETDYDCYTPSACVARLAGEYTVRYHLKKYLFGEVSGDEKDKDVVGDTGTLSVRPATAQEKKGLQGNVWSWVTVTKDVSYKDPANTLGASVALQSYDTELREQVVEQACHHIPEANWCYLTKP